MLEQGSCCICGGNEFTEGYQGRLSITGVRPACANCGSLERHRILREVWNSLPRSYLADKSALQFSMDPSVEASWFEALEVSIYEHRNSIDIQNIDRDDSSYDVILCNQILEHVEHDRQAFAELMRILRPQGFLQMTVPNPILRETTEDWGYPKTNFHGHYRHYGIDLIDRFSSAVADCRLVHVRGRDSVTQAEDYVFFWTRSSETEQFLRDSLSAEWNSGAESVSAHA